jgi:hypothetical protein
MDKIISFSLWGDKRKYVIGALANAKLAHGLFPEWRCRFYCADNVPLKIIQELRLEDAQVIIKHSSIGYVGTLWRFEVADDPNVKRFISRDSDSRLTPRDAAMVKEWEESGEPAHIIRDDEGHCIFMPAGTFGIVNGFLPGYNELLESFWEEYQEGDAEYDSFHNAGRGRMFGIDQMFLSQKVWPLIKDHHLAHIDPLFPKLRFTGKEKDAPHLIRTPCMYDAPEPYVGMICKIEKEYDDYQY